MSYSSCKGCEKRKLGCHSTCEDYQNFKNRNKEISEERQQQKELDEYFNYKKLKYYHAYMNYARR